MFPFTTTLFFVVVQGGEKKEAGLWGEARSAHTHTGSRKGSNPKKQQNSSQTNKLAHTKKNNNSQGLPVDTGESGSKAGDQSSGKKPRAGQRPLPRVQQTQQHFCRRRGLKCSRDEMTKWGGQREDCTEEDLRRTPSAPAFQRARGRRCEEKTFKLDGNIFK